MAIRIRMMASAALLLLLAASAVAVDTKKPTLPLMFKDHRDGKKSTAKVASGSYGYEESELQGACLRMLSIEMCDDKPTFATVPFAEYWESNVGCCSADGYHPKHQDVFRLPDDLKVGRCWWTWNRFSGTSADAVGADILLAGTYEVTCELEEESEKCGEPLCDDLVLKGWGRIYAATNAAILGQPSIDEKCSIDADTRRQQAPAEKTLEPVQQPAQQPLEPAQQPAQKPAEPTQKPLEPAQKPAEPAQKPAQKPLEPVQQPAQQPAQKPVLKPLQPVVRQPEQKPTAEQPASKTGPIKIAAVDNYYGEDQEPLYYPGTAWIADGYVQVISCSKKVPYSEGKMQAIFKYTLANTTPIKPSLEQFVAKPYTMDFILRKAGDY